MNAATRVAVWRDMYYAHQARVFSLVMADALHAIRILHPLLVALLTDRQANTLISKV